MNTDLTGGFYRRIYAGYITGKRINKVSMEAEAWFWRLHSIADDYGNFHGDPELVWKAASGRRKLTVAQARTWTQELIAAGLAYEYCSDEDTYIHIVGFEAKQPAGKNGKRVQKCPKHPDSGESQIIQVNPGESRCAPEILTEHYQDHNHSHSHGVSGGRSKQQPQDLPVCEGEEGPISQTRWKDTVLSALGMAPGPAAQPTRIARVARRLAGLRLPVEKKRDLAVELYALAKEIGANASGLRSPPAAWVKQALERIAEVEAAP